MYAKVYAKVTFRSPTTNVRLCGAPPPCSNLRTISFLHTSVNAIINYVPLVSRRRGGMAGAAERRRAMPAALKSGRTLQPVAVDGIGLSGFRGLGVVHLWTASALGATNNARWLAVAAAAVGAQHPCAGGFGGGGRRRQPGATVGSHMSTGVANMKGSFDIVCMFS